MARCKERGGILFNHPCNQEATMSCTACNKPICDRHMRYQADKPTCMSCVRTALKDRRSRGQASRDFQDDPYFFFFYGGHGWSDDPYDPQDYDLFDGPAGGGGDDGWQNDWEGS